MDFNLLLCIFFRNYRITGQVKKRSLLDDAMAWLNTLGGGYSALGDYFKHHVSYQFITYVFEKLVLNYIIFNKL